ncbi:extracellular solute-binding protein [uncultured Boseongicola sp.]|jgi:ABC-type glycerol-3-phosphate transport system substrate-binding protein|uniref:ABC transporter substrate-binding protein n=1 Tax=uncultured Boseongicola sp. TaxID=1648499 RepID=UPI00262BBA8E|nr:extracellular solute-binding protein [uncultured Boseongicola sp.]
MNFFKTTAASAAIVLIGSTAYADCGLSGGNVNILGNEFGAIQALVAGAKECANGSVTVESNLTTEHRDIQVAAMTANPAQYTAAIVANSSIVPLLNEGLVRPLDDLIAKHGAGIKKNQMISIDGKVMAIAFMANAQHLFVRQDILDQAGVAVPTSYEEVVTAGQAIKDAGIMEHPFAMNSKTGWNLGEEFVNMYIGTGADFFKPGTAEPAINNESGVLALNTLKALADLSNPDFLTFDSNATQALWEAGDVAIGQLWGSRATGMLDDEGSNEAIVSNTILVSAPTVGGGETPASTLWWDGFTIATNISDEDAEATFVAMVNGMRPEVVAANNDEAVWLADGFTPGPAAAGVFATASGGARPYPMIPFMGLLHSALGDELSDFLQGNESAEQALSDVEAAYTAAAKEQGFLQ